jgi:hypothetical protein
LAIESLSFRQKEQYNVSSRRAPGGVIRVFAIPSR